MPSGLNSVANSEKSINSRTNPQTNRPQGSPQACELNSCDGTWEELTRDLPPRVRQLYCWFLMVCEGGQPYRGTMVHIAEIAGISPNSVAWMIEWLDDLGLIGKEKASGSNVYRVLRRPTNPPREVRP